ncbi:MAG: T9SS type A sorting domain-containing protein [Bacteroidetes bacterium]|nr:T9SS type A sorting domain-containing protein [Bacteroidota bacterium]
MGRIRQLEEPDVILHLDTRKLVVNPEHPDVPQYIMYSMVKKIYILFILSLLISGLFAQNNALILNGAAYVVLNGGTSGTPIRLIINQSNALGIYRPVANNGWIISEGEFNYVQWNLATSTGNYVIPYSYSSTDIPFSMNITGAGVGGSSVLFSTYHTAASDNLPIPTYNGATTIPNINNASGSNNSAKMLDRWWIVDATSGYTTKPAATLTFSYIDIEHSVASNSITEANLQAQSYNTTTSSWVITDLFGTDVPASNYVNNAVVPASKLFRAWVLVDNTSPLPIELVAFGATCNREKAMISWTTASEINNDFFEVQKSTDAQYWTTIGQVSGAGNSNQTLQYYYQDQLETSNLKLLPAAQQAGETIYYRLLQSDYDGKVTIYNPVSLHCEKEHSINIIKFSESDEILISVHTEAGSSVFLNLSDVLGRTLYTKKENISFPDQTLIIKTGHLPKGIYYFTLQEENNVFTKKIFL